jgi:alpha-ribazole phosphatase/probable phosphoglycerate mutase
MRELLLIRHAETDMAGTFCGHSDPELNTRGRAQLGDLINRLRMDQIGVVYTSDLRRAHTTGKAIAEAFGIDCHVRRALREINFGQWEGITWNEIERRDHAYARRWIETYPSLPAPGGESFSDFERRVLDEVKVLSLKAEAAGCALALVTHAGVLRTVLCALQGCSEENAWEQTKSYCSVVRHTTVFGDFVQTAEAGS